MVLLWTVISVVADDYTKSITDRSSAFLIPPLFIRQLSLRWKKHFDKVHNSTQSTIGSVASHTISGSFGAQGRVPLSTAIDLSLRMSVSNQDTESSQTLPSSSTTNIVSLHTFSYPSRNITLYGLNLSLLKFKAWIEYLTTIRDKELLPSFECPSGLAFILSESSGETQDVNEDDNENIGLKASPSMTSSVPSLPLLSKEELNECISTQQINVDSTRLRQQLRQEWIARRLISDRTELLASYESDSGGVDESNKDDDEKAVETGTSSTTPKRGNFNDLLTVYSNRLVSMLKEEKNDLSCLLSPDDISSAPISPVRTTIPWLEKAYGKDETRRLKQTNISKVSQKEKRGRMQHFLDWFRTYFPYYYDRCDACGSSFKEDKQKSQEEESSDGYEEKDDVGETGEVNESEKSTFVGYMYPSSLESSATRTELYQCHKCHRFTRFPRYNSIASIIQYQRGRCGEYSILLYRLLRDLGHDARWVVDWADHVWAEVWMDNDSSSGIEMRNEKDRTTFEESSDYKRGRWIHLDPCEAAVDNPLLYSEWGKKQTYIVSFWAPPQHLLWGADAEINIRKQLWIQDVTESYTTDSIETIRERRDESDDFIESSLQKVEVELRKTLHDFKEKCYLIGR